MRAIGVLSAGNTFTPSQLIPSTAALHDGCCLAAVPNARIAVVPESVAASRLGPVPGPVPGPALKPWCIGISTLSVCDRPSNVVLAPSSSVFESRNRPFGRNTSLCLSTHACSAAESSVTPSPFAPQSTTASAAVSNVAKLPSSHVCFATIALPVGTIPGLPRTMTSSEARTSAER